MQQYTLHTILVTHVIVVIIARRHNTAGASVQAPTRVLPRLFLGGAVAADSHHLLQHIGVTHVVNAAQASH